MSLLQSCLAGSDQAQEHPIPNPLSGLPQSQGQAGHGHHHIPAVPCRDTGNGIGEISPEPGQPKST